MRILSPNNDPLENGLVGSTAITPTDFCCERNCVMSWSTNELFPTPGGPVTPILNESWIKGWSWMKYSGGKSKSFSMRQNEPGKKKI